MNLTEYQSKTLLAESGINIPKGLVVDRGINAGVAFSSLGLLEGVVKAQVPAGGRGISGGVRFVQSSAEAQDVATKLIGSRLATLQTGPDGIVVRKVLLEEVIRAEKEFYLGIVVDRSLGVPTIIFSSEGGKSIEETARTRPGKIYKEPVDPLLGLNHSQSEAISKSSGLFGEAALNLAGIIEALYGLFLRMDALLIEVNPLVFSEGKFVALDAKMVIDDNALFRHPDISSFKEAGEEPMERDAREGGISYLRLDGDVGCLANGAGLAMATMDMIRLAGRIPANFLDIGGSAHHEQVSSALRILFSDPEVRVVFVNIFGGIIHCDLIASEIVDAVRSMRPDVPIVARFEGTDAEKGKKIIIDSELPIIMVSDMEEGIERIKSL
ncbi:MAG: ADP-forming succinate--CoA ligase subunit beta [Deltaproteobacteria bacterium]|nr:ADP-forming succinate--CoA ligase subunit beta [Deltaproteobacteria bacterium]